MKMPSPFSSSPQGAEKPSEEKPCRACTDFKSWSSANLGAAKKTAPARLGSTEAPELIQEVKGHSCPLDIEELGRNTWSFLHTTAAYFPVAPTAEQRARMLTFVSSFSEVYPCEHCAGDFRESIKKHEPDVSSRKAFSTWMCEQHNYVNVKLGKDEFDCSKVLERWRDGWKDGSCD